MGDENSVQIAFLQHRDAPALFGSLDYLLKDGLHFQRVNGQYEYFSFLEENEDSLRAYYEEFFGVELACGGEGQERYYYLEFNGTGRGNIHAEHRSFIKSEFVIIGFLIYKIIYIDKNLELSSVKLLQSAIRRDYEEMKPDLYRLLAKARKDSPSQLNDEKVDDIVLEALRMFQKIGWLSINDDVFDVYPSFQRLNKLYGHYINDIDNIIKHYSEK